MMRARQRRKELVDTIRGLEREEKNVHFSCSESLCHTLPTTLLSLHRVFVFIELRFFPLVCFDVHPTHFSLART